MRLSSRVKTLERGAVGGVCCAACGMPRHGLPARVTITAAVPGSFAHIREVTPDPPHPPCALCGRRTVFSIPAPERARAGMEEAA